MVEHAIRHYPNEACGLLIGKRGEAVASEFVPMENVYDRMRQKDPEKDPANYPRTAKTAYLLDSQEQQKVFQEAERRGKEVKAIFHSHTDHDAYFSEEDRLVAAPWGEPMYPGVSYIVVSIWKGKLKEINEFYWDETKKDFVERRMICP